MPGSRKCSFYFQPLLAGIANDRPVLDEVVPGHYFVIQINLKGIVVVFKRDHQYRETLLPNFLVVLAINENQITHAVCEGHLKTRFRIQKATPGRILVRWKYVAFYSIVRLALSQTMVVRVVG